MPPLARDKHGIAATCTRKCRFDRDLAIWLNANLAGLVETGQDVAQDLARVFGARVAEGQDYAVGAAFGDRGEPSALGRGRYSRHCSSHSGRGRT